MAAPREAAMPAGIELQGSYVIRLAALDATTGNAVANVKVSGLVVTGRDLSGGLPPGEDQSITGATPLFVPIPVDPPEVADAEPEAGE